MTTIFIRNFLAILIIAISTPAFPQDKNLRGPIILTVSGAIDAPSRGPIDPEFDKFFIFNEVEFASAAQFDYSALNSLEVVEITTDYPMGEAMHVFEGPTLESVLEAAGVRANADMIVRIHALDGFSIEVSYDELVRDGAIVALRRDGALFAIGDFGPTQIVFPRSDRDDLADMNDDRWIWSIFHINVE